MTCLCYEQEKLNIELYYREENDVNVCVFVMLPIITQHS